MAVQDQGLCRTARVPESSEGQSSRCELAPIRKTHLAPLLKYGNFLDATSVALGSSLPSRAYFHHPEAEPSKEIYANLSSVPIFREGHR